MLTEGDVLEQSKEQSNKPSVPSDMRSSAPFTNDMNLSNADASFIGEDAEDYSGYSVAGAGDVNGDGYDDILIGAYGDEDGGGANAGQTYLIFGWGAPGSFSLNTNTTLPDTDGMFWLNWSESSGADNYSIYWSTSPGVDNGDTLYVDDLVNDTMLINGFTSRTYYFRMVSYNNIGATWSNELIITIELDTIGDGEDGDSGSGGSSVEGDFSIIIIIIIIIGAVTVMGGLVAKSKITSKANKIRRTSPDVEESTYQSPRIRAPIPAADIMHKREGESVEQEKSLDIDEEEKKELEETTKEVGVEKQTFICVVHKGLIQGANYICPNCNTFYCIKCAQALREKGEKCWSCESEFQI